MVSSTGTDMGSGLVVVAKGLKVAPALAPRMLDGGGKVVYGPGFVQAGCHQAERHRRLPQDLAAATQSARVGAHPVTVKAVGAKGTDLVISDADAAKLSDAHANLGFLAEGKVIIVTD